MMKRLLLLTLFFVLFVCPAISQDGSIALKAARAFDPRSGVATENAVVIVSNGKIVDFGEKLKIPDGARVVDLGDVTLLPGLIDCHTHLCTEFRGEIGEDDENGSLQLMTQSTTKRALLGAKNARECLESGITTVRDLGNCGMNADVALRDAIAQKWIPGPRMICSTRALAAAGGQFSNIAKEAQFLINQEYAIISGVEEARKAVREAFYDGADLIKVIVNTGPRVLTVEELSTIVTEARRVHKKVAAHATDPQSIKIAVDAGVDSVDHGYRITDELLKSMSEKNIYLVPTDGPADTYLDIFDKPKNPGADDLGARRKQYEFMLNRLRDRIRRAVKFNVKIAAGSDMYYLYPKRTRGAASLTMLEAYAESGMELDEVLKTATANAAELLGLEKETGSIEKGKSADFVAVSGDPRKNIQDIYNTTFVMKQGEIVKERKK